MTPDALAILPAPRGGRRALLADWLARGVQMLLCALACLTGVAGHASVQVLDRAEMQAEAGPAGSGSAWQAVTLPHEWQDGLPAYSGVVAYRMAFEWSARSQKDEGLLGVYLQRACTNAEVYLNGQQISGSGLMTGWVARNCYRPHLATVPQAVLREGRNELTIRLAGFSANEVSARQRAAGLSQVRVGPANELLPLYESQLFWNVTAAQIIAVTIGALGLAMLGLAAARRQDTYLMYFGLFSMGWALISTRLFVQHVPLDHLTTEILICSVFAPVLACANLFLIRLVERRYAWMDAGFVVQACVVPLVLWLASPGHLLRVASAVYNLLALEFVVCVGFFFTVSWRHYRKEFWLMCVALGMAVLLVALEIALQNDLLPLPKVHVIHFAMPLLFVVIGVRLVQLFVQALQRAELARVELEQRVADKSREIEHNYEQLTRLRTDQATQNERQRIAADLHDDLGAKLLTIAQMGRQGGSVPVQMDRMSGMARDALDEMRLSVRGLTGDAAQATNVLADWRSETVNRLATAGFAAHWDADEPPTAMVLPARVHVQVTRILREAVSNAIRHSGGTACHVRIGLTPGALSLCVTDDGRGLTMSSPHSGGGHGLPNIERRVRKLGGQHSFRAVAPTGTCLQVDVPLVAPSATIDPP